MKENDKKRANDGDEMQRKDRPGKRALVSLAGVLWQMDNLYGKTTARMMMMDGQYRIGTDASMIQGRVAYDAMVNSMVMLLGAELLDLCYYEEEEGGEA